MPRRERPLESEGGELVRFAGDLRLLRAAAGEPTYRQLSVRAHYSAAALSQAASGKNLPSLAVTLAYVRACSGDTDRWVARWRALAAELVDSRPVPELAAGLSPYVGLAAFQAEDAGLFFGRDRLVADLLSLLRERRFVGVFGPSGSGKSSVLRAGVIAALAAEGRRRPTLLFTPGRHPIEECAVQLAEFIGESSVALRTELAGDPGNFGLRVRQALCGLHSELELIIVVDQFEEMFTMCVDPAERSQFVNLLVSAADSAVNRTRVIIGVRADFYGHCAQFAELVAALRAAQVMVGAMTADELRQAICGPAAAADCVVETALVSRLVADAAGQPAALPLLSHALMETWRRRRGNTLTAAGYELTGGIEHAVARTAEGVFTALDPDQQRTAKQIFLRLVALGDGTEDTKRRLLRAELDPDDPNTAIVLEKLTNARLLTVDRDSIELAHEALIQCWRRLGDWLREDRNGLHIHRELTDATAGWHSLGRDSGALYRGVRLARAEDWATCGASALTPAERAFLKAGLEARAEEQARARRQTWRLRQLVALLTVLLIFAVGGVVVARQAKRLAADQRDVATVQRNVAIAQRAIMKADTLDQWRKGGNSALVVQIKLSAYRLAPNDETRKSVQQAFNQPYLGRLGGHTGPVYAMVFSPDGHLLATGGADHTVRLWNLSRYYRPRLVAVIQQPGTVRSLAFSPDGRVLAVAGGSTTVRLLDVRDPGLPVQLTVVAGHTAEVYGVTFSPDGHLLATAGGDRVVRLWGLDKPGPPRPLGVIAGHTAEVYAVAFSRDGRLVATGGGDRTVRLWRLADPSRPVQTAVVTSVNAVTSVAFSPDDRLLATAGFHDNVRMLDISNPGQPTQQGELEVVQDTGIFRTVAFTPGGDAVAAVNGTWEVNRLPQLVNAAVVGGYANHAVAVDPAGHLLAGDSSDNSVWVQELVSTELGRDSHDVEVAAELICEHAYPRITPDEWAQYFTGLPYQPPCL